MTARRAITWKQMKTKVVFDLVGVARPIMSGACLDDNTNTTTAAMADKEDEIVPSSRVSACNLSLAASLAATFACAARLFPFVFLWSLLLRRLLFRGQAQLGLGLGFESTVLVPLDAALQLALRLASLPL